MSDSSLLSHLPGLTKDTLEVHLQDDDSFLDYFNTYLALPCFAERLFYNKETRLFEEFIEKLADEAENDSTTERKASKQQQFKFLGSSVSDNSEKQSRIGYYVFVLDREQGLEFVREQRFDLFLRSHLHAEWKLSQTLSAAQASFLNDQRWNEDFADQDSAEEETSDEERNRTSTVSFNLARRNSDTTPSGDGDDGEFQAPRHFRPIQDTFDAWWDCYSKQSSGTRAEYGTESASGLSVRRNVSAAEGSVGEQSLLSGASGAQVTGELGLAEQDTASLGSYQESPSAEADSTTVISFLTERDGNDSTKSGDTNLSKNSSRGKLAPDENDVLPENAQFVEDVASSLPESCDKEPTSTDTTGPESVHMLSNEGTSIGTLQNSPTEEHIYLKSRDAIQNLSHANENGDSSKLGATADAERSRLGTDDGVSVERPKFTPTSSQLGSGHEEAKDMHCNISQAQKVEVIANLPETASRTDTVDSKFERETRIVHCTGAEGSGAVGREAGPSTTPADPSVETISDRVAKSSLTAAGLSGKAEPGKPTSDGEAAALEEGVQNEATDDVTDNPKLSANQNETTDEVTGREKLPGAQNDATDNVTDGRNLSAARNETTDDTGSAKLSGAENEATDDVADSKTLPCAENEAIDDVVDIEEVPGPPNKTTCEVCNTAELTRVQDKGTDDVTDSEKLPVVQSEVADDVTDGEKLSVVQSEVADDVTDSEKLSVVQSEAVDDVADSEILPVVQSEAADDVVDSEKLPVPLVEAADDVTDSEKVFVARNEAPDDVTDSDTHVSSLQGIRGVLSARPSSVNTSVAFDGDDASLFTEGEGEGSQQGKQYDLATRQGVENFKSFLVSTSGEKHVKFWLDVECGKHVHTDDERTRFVQDIRDKFWKSGGILELPVAFRRKLQMEDGSRLSYEKLVGAQDLVLESLSSYWCPRFTMHHQHKSPECPSLEYVRMATHRPRSCVRREHELTDVPQHAPHPGLALHVTSGNRVRPHSSYVSGQTPHKKQWRVKSAHPRLRLPLDTMHTNAGDLQLQNFTAPVRKSYGFEQPKAPSFPAHPEPDYLSSVRLYISPVPSHESRMQKMLRNVRRTAVLSANASEEQSQCICSPSDDAMVDSLLEGLLYEDQSGSFFEAFLRKAANQLWLNCLAFWKTLRQFNAHFYADVLNPAELTKKARFMYANFILTASAQDLGVSPDIQRQVRKQLEPAYEELFDAVEDHVLGCLLEPWGLCLKQETERYNKVSKEQVLRHIEIEVVQRRRESFDHARDFEGDTENIEREKISIEEANRPMPIPKDGFSFDTLIRNREELENFKEFLSKKHAKGVKDLMAWTDMETFRRTPHTAEEKRNQKAKDVRGSWLTKKYFFGPDSPATREGQNLIISLNGGPAMKERPSSPVVHESQKFVRARIERRWLEAFKQTTEFIERQKPRSAAAQELVEDLMLKRRLQRSEAAWKILNTKWVSSSRDVVALRQSLLRAERCAEFKAYLATKGETLEADVMFWLEVQKFKDMCHAHAQDSQIRRKVQTIVECFLNSAVAPELQIDIPIEMADKLLEKVTGRSPAVHPYVFREAQMTVFRVLYNHWKDYNVYRSRIPEGRNALQFLSEQLRKHRADIKAKKDASERRRLARLSAERRKKEKEERDKKRIEDLSSLFSVDTGSAFNGEEEERSSWYYSKHMVELERQEHIQRLREQGIVVADDGMTNSDDKQDCSKSRRSKHSMAKCSTHTKTDEGKLGWKQSGQDGSSDKRSSEGSVVRPRKKHLNVRQENTEQSSKLSPPSGRRGSVVSSTTRLTSAVSIRSGKETASDRRSIHGQEDLPGKTRSVTGKTKAKVPSATKDTAVKGRKVSEIQVIELEVPDERDATQDADLKGRSKLLANRSQQKKRVIPVDQRSSKEARKVPLDAISCISDYSAISNIDYSPQKTTTRRGRPGAATPLTSKSLKDFTNSPEGAPLAMPLPLVRITSASYIEPSDGEGSVDDQSPAVFRPRSSPHMSTLGRRLGKRGLQMTQSCGEKVPDVIVN